jgi:1-acyl-sn-glycerol-3-phosphate acyltransferase
MASRLRPRLSAPAVTRRATIAEQVLSAWAWVAAVFLVLVGFFYVAAVWLVTAPFDPGRYQAGRALRRLAVTHVKLTRLWRFETEGAPPDGARRPYVVVSNHESYADIFLVSHFPWEMKWLSKHTIFQIPVMGWMMRMALDVPVRRGQRESAVAALAECRDRLRRRVSVMIFPEGTRTRTDELLPFKNGAFHLAIEAGVPILPIAIAGTRDCMAKGSFAWRHAHAKARVLAPIATDGLTLADAATLRDRTRDTIDAARRALQRELDAKPA